MRLKDPGRLLNALSLAVVAASAAALIIRFEDLRAAAAAVLDNGYFGQGLYRLAALALRDPAASLLLHSLGIAFGLFLLYAAFAKPLSRLGRGAGGRSRRPGPWATGLRGAAALCLLLPALVFLWAFCLGRPAAGDRPHVILISLDTLRADHMGCYGYERDTTPSLDAFAGRNILFERCYVPEPWTLTSHVSMLTSLYPHVHGVSKDQSLSPEVTTLAEVMKNDGYHTMGIVRECGWMNPKFGFHQGFDQYKEGIFAPSQPQHSAQYQTQYILNQVRRQMDRPLFLFLHYYDVHSDWEQLPYDAPSRYRTRFYPDYQGDFDGTGYGRKASHFLIYVNQNKIELDPDLRKYITALYDGGVAYTDHWIGMLFKQLQKLGIYDKALIIVTSDHGEEFQEHGSLLHSNPYYHEEIMRVPLIVKLPGGASAASSGASSGDASGGSAGGSRIPALVESIDIMPSILDFLGIPCGAKLQGESFMPLIRDRSDEAKDHVYGFTGPGNVMVRSERWKMMSDDMSAKENYRLYDLTADPGEKKDILGDHPDVFDALLRKISGRYNEMRSRYAGERVEMTDDQMELLKKLGYLQ